MTEGRSGDILRPMYHRFLSRTLKSLAILFAVFAVALGLLSWKMSAAPLASKDMTAYVEKAFSSLVSGARVEIKESDVSWNNKEHTLTVICEDAQFYGSDGAVVVFFPKVRLKLGVWSLLRGRLLPIEMTADDAQFWLTHSQDGSWYAGGSQSGDGGMDVFPLLQKIGDEIANRFLTHDIAIKEAVFQVHDKTIEKDWSLTVREITLKHEKKTATGQAKIEVSQGERTAFLDARYQFVRPQKWHEVSLVFQDIRLPALASQHPKLAALAAIDLPLSGQFSFGIDDSLNVSGADIALEGGSGFLREESFWDKPRAVQSLSLAAHYDQAEARLNLMKFSIDLGGPKLSVTGFVQTPLAPDRIWMRSRQGEMFRVTISLESLPMESFSSVWPKTVIPNAREWIAEHMTLGVFPKGDVTLEGRAHWQKPEESEILSGHGSLSAKGGQVAYMPGMPPVSGASAEATFDLKHMDVRILEGHTGDIALKPFTLQMTDFEKETQYITIPVALKGPAQSVLRLLDSPPLGYAKAIGLNPDDAGGQVEGVLSLRMPMLSDLLLKDVEYVATAQFRNFSLRNMIPKVEVSQGTLDFHLNREGFDLKGPVALNGVPLQLVWKSAFEERPGEPLHQATVTGEVTGEGWKTSGLGDILVAEGQTSLAVRYENARKGFSTLSAEADFKNADVKVGLLGWAKPKGKTAKLALALDLPAGEDVALKTFKLYGKNLDIRGNGQLDAQTGQVRKIILKPYIVGRSHAALSYINPKDLSQPLRLDARGKALDMSGFSSKKGEGEKKETRPEFYTIDLKNFYTSEQGVLVDLKGSAKKDAIGWLEMDMKALAQGTTPLVLSLRPEEKHYRFELTSPDFGQALYGMGFTETVKGGDLWIGGVSTDEEPRVIKGKVKIGSFTVSGLPILARLFSAVSPFGFVDLITGDSSFDHLRGRFSWKGGRIDLSEVRAAGSVVGINFGGRVDVEEGNANLNGTLVPFSFVNSLIGSIPLIGDVITGGDGVIAASFKVRGPLSGLDLSVNPVSLLTPGFLRNLFFSGDSEEEETAP